VPRPAGICVAACAAAILLAGTACSGNGGKAGGSAVAHVRTLNLVGFNAYPDAQLQAYIDAVARRSHGSLRIAFQPNYAANRVNRETPLIRAVQRGAAQLAWVGSRAWESVGIDSFRPLTAPFLIDSYPLEERVLTSPLPGEMLAGLQGHGLVGLAVLPGVLWRVDGRRPLLRPAGFRGLSFGADPFPTVRSTVRALGARPFPVLVQSVSDLPASADGVAASLGTVYGHEDFRRFPYVSTNVNLWPRPYVIFANAKVYRSLSPVQQQALLVAGRDAAPAALKQSELDDSPAGNMDLCGAARVGFPVHLLTATPADLTALRRRVQPVYARIERDRRARALITRIQKLKRELGVPADAGQPCPSTPLEAARTPSRLDGVYRQHVTLERQAAYDHVPTSQENGANYGDTVWVLDRGRFATTQRTDRACTWGYGRFALSGKKITEIFADGGGSTGSFAWAPGEILIGRWSFYRDVFTRDWTFPAPPPAPETLTRVSTTPSRSALFVSKNPLCRLPSSALR
jgi:TRAP-type C4-dicarboxylate transport system substrate-binding protein